MKQRAYSSSGFRRKGGARFLVFLIFFALAGCEDAVVPAGYALYLPPPPAAWTEILGPCRWRIEWIGGDGLPRQAEYGGPGIPEIDPPQEWAVPILAFPYWPQRNISPGTLRPAGALFPFDAQGNWIPLSWKAGVEAVFYREMIEALSQFPSDKRLSPYFDWPRFRELLEDPVIDEAVRRDPWTVDWHSVALRTVRSGFDRRRIAPQSLEEIALAVPAPGPWMGTSPFAESLPWEAGETIRLGVSGGMDVYFSAAGMLRCTRETWIWIPWE
jgi:hypothetical protein